MMEHLDKYFDTAFEAPDGIKKLRQLILTLAMQGKLVPQLPKINSASQLLQLINKEKTSYCKLNNTKLLGPFTEIDSEKIPYNVPARWKWVRLGEVILSITGGGTPSKNNAEYWIGSIPWASVKDLNVDTYLDKTIDSISEKAIKESSTNLIPKGSIIVCTRMGLGKIAINTIDVTINQDLKALKLSKYVDEIFFINKFKEYKIVGKGVTVHGIRQDELLNFPFPLPPLEEQKRIVARINELYRRCDELEKLRAERDKKRLAVHTAAIRKMLDAPDQTTFDDAWQFILRHFGDLHTVRENVTELRKAILQLAVMGKLVKQDPKEGTSRDEIAQILKVKSSGVPQGKRFLSKVTSNMSLENYPFSIPKNWAWVKFEDIVTISSGVTLGRKLSINNLKTVPYLRVANVQRGFLNLESIKEIELTDNEIEKFSLNKGDLLITEGGDYDKVGRTAIWNNEIPYCAHQNHVFKARKILPKQNEQWLEMYLNSSVARSYFEIASKQTTNLASINKTQLSACLIPLPPEKEQNRIVEKTTQLMQLCDTLDHILAEARQKGLQVMESLMVDLDIQLNYKF